LGYPVHEIKEWPLKEVRGWFEYFSRRPIGWRDDSRTSYLLAAQGVKTKPIELFSSLKIMETERQRREEQDISGDANKLITSGFLHLLVKQTGWDVEI